MIRSVSHILASPKVTKTLLPDSTLGSLGALIADIVVAISGDGFAWLSAIGDLLALVTNIIDFAKDFQMARGESDADLAVC